MVLVQAAEKKHFLCGVLILATAFTNSSVLAFGNIPSNLKPSVIVSTTNEPLVSGKFAPTWQSLSQYETPKWFRDAKFGIWAHWGPQCQPEAGDWYAREMYLDGTEKNKFQLAHYGSPTNYGFKDVIHDWHAQNWDPKKLVALYKRAGAKYFFALANHHDNFDLWDSKYQPWNSVAVGPKKDLIGGWADAAREQGLRFGVSVHASHAWLWYEPSQKYDGNLTKADGRGKWWDGLDPQDLYAQHHEPSRDYLTPNAIIGHWDWGNGASKPDAAYCERFYNRTMDLIKKFHPDLIYFDDNALPLWPVSDAGLKLAANFYNLTAGKDGVNQGVIFGKFLTSDQQRCMTHDFERGAAQKIQERPWQTDTCLGDWHYKREIYEKNQYKSAKTVIHMLADIVSKNGNLLLNVPVRGDGTIDDKEVAIVQGIGDWMQVNQEAIFATRPWKVFGEGPTATDRSGAYGGFSEGKGKAKSAEDIRFTSSKDGKTLYAILLGWPDKSVTITSLGKQSGLLKASIRSISLLGDSGKVAWNLGDSSLVIQPPTPNQGDIASAAVYKISLEQTAVGTSPEKNVHSALQIMPLGDSITFGSVGANSGYRGPLCEMLNSVASKFVFVGSSTNAWRVGSLPDGQWHNEGHESYDIDDLSTNLDGFDDAVFRRHGGASRNPNGGHWLDGIASGPNARPPLYPDAILLMVGANDRDHLEGAQQRLDNLVSKIVTLRPNAWLLIARITPETDSLAHSNVVAAYNQIVDDITAKYAANHRVKSVDLNTGFPANGLSRDGLHPSSAGFDWMAKRWFVAILSTGLITVSNPIVGSNAMAYTLPELPPMPAVSKPLPPESVPMGSLADFPEMKLDFPIASGPFEPTWESIQKNYPGTPDWLRQAKFGIWVHFGPQAAGQSGDWFARGLYLQGTRAYTNHLNHSGRPSENGYKEVLRDWNPAKLDPAKLVEIYKDAGARFLLIQGVHHDNFDLWNSRYQPWNSVNLGPKRDLIGEWTKACRAADMRFGVTFHHEYSWWWYQTAFGSDTSGPQAGVPYDGNLTLADGRGKWWDGLDPQRLYGINLREYQSVVKASSSLWTHPKNGIFTNHLAYAKWYATQWALRVMDVIEQYHPDFIYTDGTTSGPFCGKEEGTGLKADAVQRVLAHYYNRTLEQHGNVDTFSIIKQRSHTQGVVSTSEDGIPGGIKKDEAWIAETPVGDWYYSPGFTYDAAMVVHYLLEEVSRDGNVAVCISPLPDGSLDEGSRQMLKQVGEWMRLNGEGIYGSRAWVKYGEGQQHFCNGKLGSRQANWPFSTNDFRFTVGANGSLYGYCMKVPEPGAQLKILSLGTDAKLLAGKIQSVTLLGGREKLSWSQQADGLVITCPQKMPFRAAVGFKIETEKSLLR